MWFNILKIENRQAAYRFFINSMVHRGELITPKDPREILDEGETRLLGFETRNGHFEWEVEYDEEGKMGKFYLATVPTDIEPYMDYIEGMFEQEYPEQYAALQEFFKENAPPSKWNQYNAEEDEDSDTPANKKKIIRKVIFDWKNYMDQIIAIILDSVDNIGINIPAPRYKRLLERDIHTSIPYKLVRDYIYSGRLTTRDLPLATIEAIKQIYADALRRRNPDIVWENFINFIIYFREEYMHHIFIMANQEGDTEDLYQAMQDSVKNVSGTSMVTLARNIWRTKADDVETLMRQLPNYN